MAKAKNGWVATDRYKQAMALLRGRSGVMYNDAICSKANGPGRSIKISAADKRFHAQLGELADRVVVTPSYRNAYGQAGLNTRYHFYMNGKPSVCKTSPKRTRPQYNVATTDDETFARMMWSMWQNCILTRFGR